MRETMKIIWCCCAILFILSGIAKGQDSTRNAKIDTLLLYQKKMSIEQEKIYDEIVRYKEPLANKKYGIEIDPAYLLASSARSYFVLTGGFSFFDVDRHAEIACPFFYQRGTIDNSGSSKFTAWDQDLLYRNFLGLHQDGFYLQGGLRFTHLSGDAETSSPITIDKLGAIFGIGYRYFSTSGLYWGTSIVYGAYFSGDETTIEATTTDDSKTIIDIEILKFGYAF